MTQVIIDVKQRPYNPLRLAVLACICAGASAWTSQARAQTEDITTSDDPIDAYARWATSQGVWKGPTTRLPDRTPRPSDEGHVLQAEWEPIAVHAPPGIALARTEAALSAARYAIEYLREQDWPLPLPDGGAGRTTGFDLYLRPHVRPAAQARMDGTSGHGLHDDAVSHAVVSADATYLEACVVSAIAQAALLGADPAESARFRQATGAYVAWLATGHFGCEDADVNAQQKAAEGWLPQDEADAARGGLWLALLADRTDGGSGAHIRELWQFARQTSDEVNELRASPNLWEVTARSLQNAGDDLEAFAIDLGVARYFAGPEGRRSHAPYPTLRQVPEAAAVPLSARLSGAALPRHVPLPAMQALGSAYVRVHLQTVTEGQQLKVWLRGESGPRWALSAVRLGARGEELGRLHAPVRSAPRGYLPLMLTTDTRAVLLVVTYLPTDFAASTRRALPEHAAKLIVDIE